MLKADGFDNAIIGFCTEKEVFVYDKFKMIEILMEDDKMSEVDAMEYLSFNVWCAYIGEHTPIYVDVMSLEEWEMYNPYD